jgi:hypothetical protein
MGVGRGSEEAGSAEQEIEEIIEDKWEGKRTGSGPSV